MTRASEIVQDYLRLQESGQNVEFREYATAWYAAAELNQEAA